jgi:F-type H+-transporting ATPase subunit b
MASPSGGGQGAFPPFDTTTFGSQLFWFAIVFGALYWLSARVVVPRLGGVIADRNQRIAADLDEAAKMQAKAQAAGEAYEKALADARANAQTIARDTREKLNAASDARRKQVEQDLAGKLADAEKRVETMKTKAMTNVEGIASGTVSLLVEKLIGVKPAAATISAAVKTALGK